jgi:hypothetical protein
MPDCARHITPTRALHCAFLCATLLAANAARADDASLARCRAITDAAARLACYDALPLTGSVAQPAAPMAPAAAASANAATAPQAQAMDTPQQFGLEERTLPKNLIDHIDSTIPGKFEGWWPNARFRLANGQVWQVDDGSSRLYDVTDPKVTIERGMMGAFYLNLAGDNRTVRVRRIQ